MVKEEENEPAAVRKRKSGNMANLVGNLISTTVKVEPKEEDRTDQGGGVVAMPEAGPSKLRSDDGYIPPANAKLKEEQKVERRLVPERQQSVLHRLRATAFEEPATAAEPSSRPPTDTKTTSSFPPTALARIPTPSTQPLGPVDSESRQEDGDVVPDVKFYDGLRFCHVIEEQCVGLEQAILAHGGMLVSNEDRLKGAEVDYIVVRL